jgi:hypothetical protein
MTLTERQVKLEFEEMLGNMEDFEIRDFFQDILFKRETMIPMVLQHMPIKNMRSLVEAELNADEPEPEVGYGSDPVAEWMK